MDENNKIEETGSIEEQPISGEATLNKEDSLIEMENDEITLTSELSAENREDPLLSFEDADVNAEVEAIVADALPEGVDIERIKNDPKLDSIVSGFKKAISFVKHRGHRLKTSDNDNVGSHSMQTQIHEVFASH